MDEVWSGGGNGTDDSFGEEGVDLVRRLRQLERWVPPDELDELWIFPPLQDPEGTRSFFLFTRASDEGRRRVYSARGREVGRDERASPAAAGNGAANGDGGDTERGGSAGEEPPSPGARDDGAGDGEGLHDGEGLQSVEEHGQVPTARLPDIVERFLRRLGEERAPVHVEVEGRRERWTELLSRFAPDDGAGAYGAGRPDGPDPEEAGSTRD